MQLGEDREQPCRLAPGVIVRGAVSSLLLLVRSADRYDHLLITTARARSVPLLVYYCARRLQRRAAGRPSHSARRPTDPSERTITLPWRGSALRLDRRSSRADPNVSDAKDY